MALRCTLVRLLMRLHFLLLLSMLLLELLSLLSVALFHLLFLSVAGILLGYLLVFFFLLLLELLVFLILFGGQLVLLLLILFVRCWVARACRRVLMGLNIGRVVVVVGTNFVGIWWTICVYVCCMFGSFVGSSGFSGGYGAALEVSGP